jgi:threonylcarbamoyladenosine tRNA methylthiotransferase MtaB
MVDFHVEHFGCRAARADGEAVMSRLRAAGMGCGDADESDVVVVNTCSVTAEADRAARAFIRRTHRLNPQARIVVTGCYAQRAPEELSTMAGVAAVVGNSHKAFAPEIVLGLVEVAASPVSHFVGLPSLVAPSSHAQGSAPVWADDSFAHSFIEEAQLVPGEQTRPNLKIQEGCGNRCTFCVIPQTRGSSRSLSRAAILRQVDGFVAAGGNELVLSGINLGRWGRDLAAELGAPVLTLAELVREIVERTGLPRLRLSSIEPMDWNTDLIGLMAEFGGTRIARHAHLPLQSGSDAVLRRMHRRYRPWHYAEKVTALIHAVGPDLTLGADAMVGFPAETDAEFEETMAMVRALPFGYLHLFPFSPRPGTRGWGLHCDDPVPRQVVDERMAALRALALEKTRTHRMRFIGRTLDAITLHTSSALAAKRRGAALTENFLPVELSWPLGNSGPAAANERVKVHITGLNLEGVLEASEAGFSPGVPEMNERAGAGALSS